ncbi:MAG: hypothetical protein E7363_01640 [Clostridiales bacterium]|nr:hypothetical protein [Clostridiales bacterium]
MINYVIAVLAALGFAGQFCMMKLYQKHTQKNMTSSMVFSICMGITSFLLFFIMSGFTLEFTLVSFLVSLAVAIVGVLSTINSIAILSYGKVSFYSVFMMLGGMMLPYIFGIIMYSEVLSDLKLLGLIVLTGSLIMSSFDKSSAHEEKAEGQVKAEKRLRSTLVALLILSFVAFFLNGMTSVLGSIQGNAPKIWGWKVSPLYDYMALQGLCTAGVALLVFFSVFFRKKEVRNEELGSLKLITKKWALIALFGYAIISRVANLLQQYCADKVPSSVLYPITSGGTIVFSTLLALILYKEKPSRFMWLCIGITVFATVLFMLGDMFPTTYVKDFFVNLFN